jgi:hypothetical protein
VNCMRKITCKVETGTAQVPGWRVACTVLYYVCTRHW